MIYCNINDVTVDQLPARIKCARFFNADNEDVIEILPADPITVLPLLPTDDRIMFVVDRVEDGWVYPLVPNISINLDDLPKGVGVYKGQGE